MWNNWSYNSQSSQINRKPMYMHIHIEKYNPEIITWDPEKVGFQSIDQLGMT